MDVNLKFRELLNRKNLALPVFSMFEALPDTPKRVKFVQNLMEEHNVFPKNDLRHPKNDDVSKMIREDANHLYRQRLFVGALEVYNKAICFAGAEGLSLGYANRAAAYFELKLYDECLDNVRLAREAGYPIRLLSKLAERETKCREAMQKRLASKKPTYQPKLSYPAIKENPSVANCIELAVSEKYGRHFLAKQDLKVGDIVILEEPYQVYLSNSYKYRKCANCLIENGFNLIPCLSCNKTMFCSQLCSENASKFHKIICPIVDLISEWPESHYFFALRILLSLIQDFGSVEALAASHKSGASKTRLAKCDGDDKLNKLNTFHAMEPKHEVIQLDEAIWLAMFFYWLIKKTDLVGQLGKVKSHDLFLDLWHRYHNIIGVSSFPAVSMKRTPNGGKLENLKFKIYYFNWRNTAL
jgi:MYND finger